MHSLDIRTFHAPADSDTLVISPYPVGGNHENSGARYQEEARLTGCDVTGMVRTGSNTLRFRPELRRQLSPEHFDELCAEEASDPALQNLAARYDHVIMRGQSTGSFSALGMVKSEAIRVTHLGIDDGINLRTRRNGHPKGPLASRLDWAAYTLREFYAMPQPPADYVLPTSEQDAEELSISALLARAVKNIGKHAVEEAHFAPLWRSGYSRQTLLDIAATRPELPVYVRFPGHSATSTVPKIDQFTGELHAAREAAKTTHAAVCVHVAEDAWHKHLLYPQFGKQMIQTIRGFKSLVR